MIICSLRSSMKAWKLINLRKLRRSTRNRLNEKVAKIGGKSWRRLRDKLIVKKVQTANPKIGSLRSLNKST
jgi:hypothetical protein